MKRIFIIRHGKTQWNLEKRLQGAGANSKLLLDDANLANYGRLATYLDTYQFAAAYASPIERATETARLVIEQFKNNSDLKIQQLDDLKEVSFGKWEGRSKAELMDENLELFKKLSKRQNDPELAAIGVENFTEARQRFANTIQSISAKLGPDENAVVFAHGGISQLGIKELTHNEHLLGLKNLSTSIIAENHSDFFIDVYNQTAYLQDIDLNEGNVSIL
ncbi:hypothetical protein C5L31_001841 [Secundilactobacillus malefermentans]|uniref:Phosphoglycerate mutase n=2 Tax=Secundilactobacillus malefermentans TaxID=176292 RepID=A0A4R5NDF5_9LACO|nr:histidine phosphatase family protein [Secundilactobacillus malefermentans]TDG71154.1 hypothetical protein C5L31_001841 [Secundilactobacillus malefermentans]